MKRSDTDNGRVKDSGGGGSSVAAVTTSSTVPVTMPTGNAIANVFPLPLPQPQQQPSAQAPASANFQRVITHGGGAAVAVFRDGTPGGTTTITAAAAQPPAAHTGPGSGPTAHHITSGPPSVVVTQPPANIKPESITLPNTPVSVQYAPFPPTMTGSHNPATVTPVKSLPPHTTSGHQIIHPKSYGQPAIRTISTATLPTQPASANSSGNSQNNTQFQRLKVEDALSYLDQVKYKFGNQPQVYNDFLDIMKEFKSQSIDTPGVIARVSCLFRGHPELIVGFNTFLPPGYKIEVQRNDSITMNMGGLLGPGMQTIVHTPTGVHTMGAHGHMSAISPSSTASIITQNVTINQQSLPQQPQQQTTAVPIRPVTIQHATKFAPNVVKAENNRHDIPQGVQLFSAGPGGPQQIGSLPPHVNNASVSLTPANVPAAATPPVNQPPTGPPPSSNSAASNAGVTVPAVAAATVSAPPPPPPPPPSADRGVSQPVEFNHAINYVNKIKNRFQGQPDVYKQFLEILHTYQKDQKAIKEGVAPSGRHLTEAEVYSQVSKLFQNQEDLLSEFGQFLPEATNDNATSAIMLSNKGLNNDHTSVAKKPSGIKPGFGSAGSKYGNKRPPSGISHPAPKKPKMGVLRDVSLSEAGKFGTLNEFAFFDKVRKALRNPAVYENFLRCLILFNQEVISRSELVQVTTPFLNKHPDLFKWFKDFLGHKEGGNNNNNNNNVTGGNGGGGNNSTGNSGNPVDSLSQNIANRDRHSGDSTMEIDYATCRRLGASYCGLPKNVTLAQSSRRTQLCREVLNDTWVSFPTWSEDSQFVTSRKTQYEESIYRTEDERFEFDVILETNRDTIKVLECVQRKMSRMPPEEAARYRLDETLGGTSQTIHQRAIRRIYGDKAHDIIQGLMRNPVVAVPIVLKRLTQKDEEWREVQKNFNKTWRDQNEKYYLKSLDHQGLSFKQSDIRNLRSKSLLNEIETLYDERHEQQETSRETISGPHMTLEYVYPAILEDANNLLIHHVKRQPSIHKEDKQKIKALLKHFLMDMFHHQRQELSEDEKEENEDEDDHDNEKEGSDSTTNASSSTAATATTTAGAGGAATAAGSTASSSTSASDKDKETTQSKSTRARRKREEKKEKEKTAKKEKDITEKDIKIENKDGRRTPLHARDMEADETYTHMMCNNNWYLFIRLHNILCERLTKIYNQAVVIANEEGKDKKDCKDSTAVALRLKPKNEIDAEDYYPAFLDMVKNLLDGNMDAITFEDTLREMFGIHAYIAYTLDKVVINTVRQLQHLVTDEACIECQDLYHQECKNNATGGPCSTAAQRIIAELLYQKRSEKLLADENCMKVLFYHQSSKVTIEMLDTETDVEPNSEQDDETSRKWHKYIERFIQPGEDVSEECKEHLTKKPVFLPRGIRSYRRSPFGTMKIANKPEVSESNIDDKSKKDSSNKGLSNNHHNIVYDDNIQCNFNPRSFKVLYVIKSENCFYRRLALRRAKESHKTVSRRKTEDFNRWHSTWVQKNVNDSQQTAIADWFMGKTDGLVPNKTHKIVKNDLDTTPYRTFYRWRADVV